MNSIITQRFIKCHDRLREEGRVRSSRQFAMSLDYLPQSLSEILKNRRDVTIELLRKAIEKYKMNPVYVLTGDGPMFMTEEDHKTFRVLTIVTDSKDEERIVHVPVPAQAGYAAEMAGPSFVQDLPSFTLPDYKYKAGTHRSFDVGGDSMEPTLFEGDKVICSYVEPTLWENAVKDNYVYVIVTRGDVLVKRVLNHLKEEKALLLTSDNAFYEPYRVSMNDIREIWFVRAKISPFLPAPQNHQNRIHEEMRELRHTVQQQIKQLDLMHSTIEKMFTNNGRTHE
ncbi:MAG: peptidase S24 [Saprospiraceae bacterium]|nr:peptidase S24 [Saprospiraceae bacterium]